jgi:hypothetical protein
MALRREEWKRAKENDGLKAYRMKNLEKTK